MTTIPPTTDSAIERLLAPAAVALVGATDDPRRFSGGTLANLLRYGYRGRIFPVNPKREHVQGLRCYPSVSDLPAVVDTAIVTLPAPVVPAVLEECDACGARSAVVISSGFSKGDHGAAGEASIDDLRSFTRSHDLRVLGPNTIGLVNLRARYVARAAANQLPPGQLVPGALALVSQSGASANITMNRAQSRGVGISYAVATGDEVDLSVWDFAHHFVQLEDVRAVLIILEGIRDPAQMEVAAGRASALGKPLIVLKLGKSETGKRTVLAHSGALAGDARVLSAVMKDLGMIEVNDYDALWETGQLFAKWTRESGEDSGRLGIVSISGGEAALAADEAERSGLELPPVTDQFREFVEENLSYAFAQNPFDPSGEVISSPEKLSLSIRAFTREEQYSEILVATPPFVDEAAGQIMSALAYGLEDVSKRIALSTTSITNFSERQESILRSTGLPLFDASVRAIGAIARFARYAPGPRSTSIEWAGAALGTFLDLNVSPSYAEAKELLAGLGFPVPRSVLVRDADEVAEASSMLLFPLVAKGNVRSDVHKSDAGLVRLGVKDGHELRETVEAMLPTIAAHGGEGVVLEETATGSLHLLAGLTRTEFGPMLVLGSGGAAVEYLDDTVLRPAAHVDAASVLEQLLETKSGAYLARRSAPLAAEIARSVVALAVEFSHCDALAAIELNPISVDVNSLRWLAIDARIEL